MSLLGSRLSLCAFCLAHVQALFAQPCTLAWNDPVSGLFSEAGRWTTSPQAPADCQGRAPRSGDSIAFRPGPYVVDIPGSYSLVVTEFDVAPTPANIQFNLGGSLTTRILATSGQFTVTGAGQLAVTELFNMGGDATAVIDGARTTLGPIVASRPGPPDPSRRLLVRNRGTLVTLADGVPGTTVDGATWLHQGPADGVSHIALANGAQFEALALDLKNSRLSADSGSTVDIEDFKTTSEVFINGGSQMTTRTVSVAFGNAIVAGTGSRWTIADRLLVPAATQIVASNRAQILAQNVTFSDPAKFAGLHAKGTDSRVTLATPLVLLAGNASATDGGHFSVPSLEVGSACTVTVGQGSQGLGGAQFDCRDEVVLGSNGPGLLSVLGGGRASARWTRIGFSQDSSLLDINGASGTARFVVGNGLEVGKQGRGALRVRNGGRLEFNQPGGLVTVTPDEVGDGEVTVDGIDSTLEIPSGAIHVGRSGPGRLSVTGGGTVVASHLNIGDTEGTGARLALVIGSGSSIHLREGSLYLAQGTLRAASGGFVQITSGALEGSLVLQSPSLVDLATGSLEIGNGGGAPQGILRVDRGLLRGGGTIRASSVEVVAQGRCAPGLLTENDHLLRIQDGHYLQDANGTLEIDVFGAANAPEALQLQVDRSVRLNGKLIVNFLANPPRAGDQVGFLRYGESITGSFASVEIRGLDRGVAYEQRILSPGLYGLAFTSDATRAVCSDPPPRIRRIDLSTPGQVAVTVDAGLCGIHRLESSTDLRGWRTVQSFTGDASGTAVVLAPRSSSDREFFYRVVRY
ncbi:MAG: hypothetical protein JNK85_30385 [Verrucomicrobiales bacterium]|nr:hypothetical protein [Verrucomicrobiales bacterium]